MIEERVDYFGNPVHYFTIQEPHRELTVEAAHRITVTPNLSAEPGATPSWEVVRDRPGCDHCPVWLDAYQFAFDSRYAAADPRYAELRRVIIHPPGRPILEAALHLVERIHAGFAYDPKATTVTTPVAEAFEKRRGVCQDSAHFLLACLRSTRVGGPVRQRVPVHPPAAGPPAARRRGRDPRLGEPVLW